MTTPTDAELDALVAKAADGLCTRSALSRSDAGVIDLTATVALLSGLADAITALRAELAAERAKVEAMGQVIAEGRRAVGDHFSPHDCYATGPSTGDPLLDLVQCPACSFISMNDAITSTKGATK